MLWVAAGNNNGTFLNDIWNTADGLVWQQATSSATWSIRSWPSIAKHDDGFLYLAAGATLNDVWRSSDGTNWAQLTSSAAWSDRNGAQMNSFGGQLIFYSGVYTGTRYDDVWSSSNGVDWTQSLAHAPWRERSAAISMVYGDHIYLMGGEYDYQQSIADVWRLGSGSGESSSTNGLGDGLVLHFTFDADESGSVSDLSGWQNDGLVQGASWTNGGVLGGCYRFSGGSGAGDAICVSNSASLVSMQSSREISFSMWLKPNSIPSEFPVVLSKGSNKSPGAYGGYEFHLNGNGDDDLGFQSGNCTVATDNSNGQWINNHLGEWIHVAFTLDVSAGPLGEGKFYVNGERTGGEVYRNEFGHLCYSNVNFDLTAPLYLGRPDPAAHSNRAWYDGLIDEVRIYNRVISSNDVAALYQSEAPSVQTNGPADTLVLHYTFDSDDASQVVDASDSGHTGVAIGGTWVEHGVFGGAYSFNGVDDYIYVGPVISNLSAFTMSAWVKLRRFTHESYMGIMGQQEFRYPVSADPYYVFYVSPIQGFGTVARWGDGTAFNSTTTHVIPIHAWHWVVQTYDGGIVKQYDNGVLVNTISANGKRLHGNGPLLIGKTAAYPGQLSVNYFAGEMDDVRIYSRAMSPQEITEQFRMGSQSVLRPVTTGMRRHSDPNIDTFSMSWPGIGADQAYAIECSPSLTSPSWGLLEPLDQWPIYVNSWSGTVSNAPGEAGCFFRVRSWPAP